MALFSECHIRADRLVARSKADVPLDPEEQPDYQANREISADHAAFLVMKDGAEQLPLNQVAHLSQII